MLTKKVLLVEDDVVTAKIVTEHLKALGYIVTAIVASEIEAISSIATEKPDLVLMDIDLGVETRDGIAIVTRIRNQFQIPTIFLTASHSVDIVERPKTSTPFGYLTKSCSRDDLNIAIQIALHRHHGEQQLADRYAMLSTILNSTSDGVVAVDAEGKITYMNPAAENITGSSLAEVYGQKSTNVMSFVSELTNRPVVNPLIQAMELQKACYLRDRTALVVKNGIKLPVIDSTSPIFSNDGIVDGAVLVFSNISDRRKSQQLELEKAKQEVPIYQQEEVEAVVRDALSQAEAMSDQKSQFLSIVSHELRAPLTSILLSADLLEIYAESWTPDKIRHRLRRISNNVRRATDIIEDILTLGKAEAGMVNFNPSLLDLVEYCQDLVLEMRLMISSSISSSPDIELIFDCKLDEYLNLVDESLLQQIFPNLLTNAIKYSKPGGKVFFNLDCTGDMAIFRVIDNGIGIPEAEISFLFQPFRRASNVGGVRGSGIGLAIVKRALELHGGQIFVKTELGQGTTFTVLLPISQPNPDGPKSS
jgi:PAS domain S-box-containing protein